MLVSVLPCILMLASIGQAQSTPPAGFTITVSQTSGQACSPNNPPSVQLLENGRYLEINYTNFVAYTDVTDRFNDRSCTVIVDAVIPAGWSFGVRNPVFDGDLDLDSGANAQFRAYHGFSPFATATTEIDETNMPGPINGTYSVLAPAPASAVTQTSSCGNSTAKFEVVTRVTVGGGIPNPYPASGTVTHHVTTSELFWIQCST